MGKSIVRALGAIANVLQAAADFVGYLFLALFGVILLIPVCIMVWVTLRALLF